MKRYMQTFASFTLLCLMSTISADESLSRRVAATPGGTLPSFHYMTGVSNGDFRNAGETTLLKTYTITSPGTYTLVQDIGFDAVTSAGGNGSGAAIYINSSDVVLDLGGRTLYSNDTTPDGTDHNGIDVNSSLANITIRNGNIRGFTGVGIEIENKTNNIRIENVSIADCINRGIDLLGTGSGTEVADAVIDNCIISKTGHASEATTPIGLNISYGYNITVSNSNISSSISNTGDVKNVAVDNSYNVTFIDCEASNAKCTLAVSGGAAHGFSVGATGVNISFIRCSANSNTTANTTGATKVAAGFYAATTCHACSFIDCVANGNNGTGTGAGTIAGAGFYLNDCANSYFENCRASYNYSDVAGYGFYQTTVENNMYKNCVAIGNYNSGANGAADTDGGHGFHSATGTGSSFEKCLSVGNIAFTGNGNTTVSAGFFISAERNTIFLECEARANGADGNSEDAAGFYLDGECNGCLLDGCRSIGNEGATGYGFTDELGAASNSLIIDCLAFGNSDTNYNMGNISVNDTLTNLTIDTLTSRNPFENLQITYS